MIPPSFVGVAIAVLGPLAVLVIALIALYLLASWLRGDK